MPQEYDIALKILHEQNAKNKDLTPQITLFFLTFLLQMTKMSIIVILNKRSLIYEGICDHCKK